MPQFSIYAQRTDRLTSRLEGLLSVWRFARVIDRKTVLYWPQRRDPYQGETYRASSILDLEAMASDPASNDLSVHDKKYLQRKDVRNFAETPGWDHSLERHTVRDLAGDFYVGGQTNLKFPDEKACAIEAEKKSLYARLRPRPIILKNVAAALDWLGPGEFSAVHLRRGDLLAELSAKMRQYEGAARSRSVATEQDFLRVEDQLAHWMTHFVVRAAPMEAYLDALADAKSGVPPGQRLVIFSDSEEAARDFQKQCGSRDVLLMSSFGTELTEIQRSYVEVLLLTHAQRIISTYSTFGKFASHYGDRPFTDVRAYAGPQRMRSFFAQTFASDLAGAPWASAKCEELLEKHLRQDKLQKLLKLVGWHSK